MAWFSGPLCGTQMDNVDFSHEGQVMRGFQKQQWSNDITVIKELLRMEVPMMTPK